MAKACSTEGAPDIAMVVPRHVAVVMDGNGRWAAQRHLPRMAGHRKGVEAARAVVEACVKRGVQYVTLFAFSSENWHRPVKEVSFLMRLFKTVLESELVRLNTYGIRLQVIGDLSMFEARIRDLIQESERRTAGNTGLLLTIAANYGGRWDIVQASGKIAEQAARVGQAVPLKEDDFARYLALAYAPDPDLLIRTGGEQRLSNFLLWQLAYTELYFTEQFWPDFNESALDVAFAAYRERERRFGRTSTQLKTQRNFQAC